MCGSVYRDVNGHYYIDKPVGDMAARSRWKAGRRDSPIFMSGREGLVGYRGLVGSGLVFKTELR